MEGECKLSHGYLSLGCFWGSPTSIPCFSQGTGSKGYGTCVANRKPRVIAMETRNALAAPYANLGVRGGAQQHVEGQVAPCETRFLQKPSCGTRRPARHPHLPPAGCGTVSFLKPLNMLKAGSKGERQMTGWLPCTALFTLFYQLSRLRTI